MVTYLFLLITISSTWNFVAPQSNEPFFRKDYTYLDVSKSFYKIHTFHRTWLDAKKRCAMEGAQLFYADDKAEADAVLQHWKATQPFNWVYVGISALLSKGDFETVDGRPVADVYNVWGPGEPNDAGGVEDCVIIRTDGTLNDDGCTKKYPFICKKSFSSMEWNFLCDIPDIDYLYNGDLGKCYKFHLNPSNWTEAYSICSAEQSYLAIINDQKEADYLVNLTSISPKDSVSGNYLRGAVLLGFHNKDEEGWKTIKGVPLSEIGYPKWGGGQPDGGSREQCGSMFYSGGLNDLGCEQRCFFICEHDLGASTDGDIDIRFSEIQ